MGFFLGADLDLGFVPVAGTVAEAVRADLDFGWVSLESFVEAEGIG